MIENMLQEWGGIAFAVLNLLLVWILWSLGRRFASKDDLLPLSQRLDLCDHNLQMMRQDVNYLPSQSEIEALRRATSALEVKIARTEATLRKLDETARQLSDYLLHQRGI